MATLSIHLLGPFDVHTDDGRGMRPASLKAQELLCYLLLRRGQRIGRDELSNRLWADLEARRCRKHLRHALWQLQSTLGHSGGRNVLEVTADTVALPATADLWLDVAEFQIAVEQIRRRGPEHLDADDTALARLDRAASLYRGDLLEGFDFDWCLVEREWLKSGYVMLLDQLMIYCEHSGEYSRGVHYGERVLRIDRAREYTHRHLMYLHHMRGDRTGAIRQYAHCETALRQELSIAPADSTKLLCEQIRKGRDIDPLHASRFGVADRLPAARVDRLHRLRHALIDLQRQVDEEILAVGPTRRCNISPEPPAIDLVASARPANLRSP